MVMLEPEERPVDSEADTDVDEEESEDDSLPDLDEEDSPVLPPVAKRARYFSAFFLLSKIRKNYICFFFAEDESILTMNPHP